MDPAFLALLRNDGLVQSDQPEIRRLTGGVSSEIYQITEGSKSFVVKRALAKLKVEADWYADVTRNAYEAAFIRYVGKRIPGSVPELISQGDGYFAMEFLGDGFKTWKNALLDGQVDLQRAHEAGALLGHLQILTMVDPAVATRFDTAQNFFELRVSPYLLHIAERYPEHAELILEEANRLLRTKSCLIHGDFSPKNILISLDRMVIVDCEVAYYGDSAFDVAFFLTHLLLKGLYHAPREVQLDGMATAFLSSYLAERTKTEAIDRTTLQRTIGRLLTMLLLARVDGKSPVEYLDPSRQNFVRSFTLQCLESHDFSLDYLIENWFTRAHRAFNS